MAEVISGENISRHNVDKYNFKVLAIGGGSRTNLKSVGVIGALHGTHAFSLLGDSSAWDKKENYLKYVYSKYCRNHYK